MPEEEHRTLGAGSQHIIENWTYANEAAREGAVGLLPADVGKVAYQVDTLTYWRLTDDDPVAWAALGGTGDVTQAELDAEEAARIAADAAHAQHINPHPTYATDADLAAHTAHASDAHLLDRANHTGTQLAATVSDFNTAVQSNRITELGQPNASLSMAGFSITDVLDPTNDQDAATRKYVDDNAGGSVTASVPLASSGGATPNITATVGTTANTLAAGDDSRVLASVAAMRRKGGGLYYHGVRGPSSSFNPTLNMVYAAPFDTAEAITLDRIGCVVVTFVASSVARLGIYSDSGAGYPGALLLDAGTVDTSTNGNKEITISQALPAGRYWLALVAQVASASLRYHSHNDPFGTIGSATHPGPTVYGSYSHASVTGALPGTFTSSVTTQIAIFVTPVRIV